MSPLAPREQQHARSRPVDCFRELQCLIAPRPVDALREAETACLSCTQALLLTSIHTLRSANQHVGCSAVLQLPSVIPAMEHNLLAHCTYSTAARPADTHSAGLLISHFEHMPTLHLAQLITSRVAELACLLPLCKLSIYCLLLVQRA